MNLEFLTQKNSPKSYNFFDKSVLGLGVPNSVNFLKKQIFNLNYEITLKAS
jgi:hypothetical protein